MDDCHTDEKWAKRGSRNDQLNSRKCLPRFGWSGAHCLAACMCCMIALNQAQAPRSLQCLELRVVDHLRASWHPESANKERGVLSPAIASLGRLRLQIKWFVLGHSCTGEMPEA